MNATRLHLAVAGIAATIAVSGCFCDAEEQQAVTFSAIDSLVIVRDGVSRKAEFVTRVTGQEVDPSSFQFVFNTIEGSTSGDGIALTLSETGQASNEFVVLTLALPASLRRGDEYPVSGTFNIEPGFTPDPRLWGPYDLRQPDQAEAAFIIAAYTFPPPLFTTNFRAVTSSGTVRVTVRERGRIELLLNLTFVAADGKRTTVSGRAQATSERYTPPCIS